MGFNIYVYVDNEIVHLGEFVTGKPFLLNVVNFINLIKKVILPNKIQSRFENLKRLLDRKQRENNDNLESSIIRLIHINRQEYANCISKNKKYSNFDGTCESIKKKFNLEYKNRKINKKEYKEMLKKRHLYIENEANLKQQLFELIESMPKIKDITIEDIKIILNCIKDNLNGLFFNDENLKLINVEQVIKYIDKYNNLSFEKFVKKTLPDPSFGIIINKVIFCFGNIFPVDNDNKKILDLYKLQVQLGLF